MPRPALTLAALAALLACPQAHAFPPCPVAPLDLSPLDTVASRPLPGATAPWFQALYTLVGSAAIISSLTPDDDLPNSGKCTRDDWLPTPESNDSTGVIQLRPHYAPAGGFGLIALPELPAIAAPGLKMRYRADFSVDNGRLPHDSEWIDLAQLEFLRNAARPGKPGTAAPESLASVYRARKKAYRLGPPVLEIIESNAAVGNIHGARPGASDRVIASIPLDGPAGRTALSLQWRQRVVGTDAVGTTAATAAPDFAGGRQIIDSQLEVIAADGTVLSSRSLPGQWASTFSMGLIDYHLGKHVEAPQGWRVHLGGLAISARDETYDIER